MPFELLFPAKYKEEIIIDLPQEWKVDESEKKIKNSCYTYNYKFYCLSNRVHLDAEYENYKDHVEIDETTTYFKNMNEYDDANSFELTSGGDNIIAKKSSDTDTKNILYTILFIGIIVGGMVWWSQRK